MSCLTGKAGLWCHATFQCLPVTSLKIKVLCLAGLFFFLPTLLTRTYLHPVESKRIYGCLREAYLSKCVEHSAGIGWNTSLAFTLVLRTVNTQKTLDSSFGYQNRHDVHGIKVLVSSALDGRAGTQKHFCNYLSAREWLDIGWMFIFAQNVALTCFLLHSITLDFSPGVKLPTAWMGKIWHRDI